MYKVKCNKKGLNITDRQNIHNCNVIVRVLVRIESEINKYRQKKEIKKKTNSLNE